MTGSDHPPRWRRCSHLMPSAVSRAVPRKVTTTDTAIFQPSVLLPSLQEVELVLVPELLASAVAFKLASWALAVRSWQAAVLLS